MEMFLKLKINKFKSHFVMSHLKLQPTDRLLLTKSSKRDHHHDLIDTFKKKDLQPIQRPPQDCIILTDSINSTEATQTLELCSLPVNSNRNRMKHFGLDVPQQHGKVLHGRHGSKHF